MNDSDYALKSSLKIYIYIPLSPHISEYPVNEIISVSGCFRKRTQWSHKYVWIAFMNSTPDASPHPPDTQLLCRNAFICGKCLSILLTGKAVFFVHSSQVNMETRLSDTCQNEWNIKIHHILHK